MALSVAFGDSSPRGRAKGETGLSTRKFLLPVAFGDSPPRGRAKGDIYLSAHKYSFPLLSVTSLQ